MLNMRHNGLIRVIDEQRRYNRASYDTPVQYRYASNLSGQATCMDVSLGGLRLRLGRYLRPGTYMLVTLNERTEDGEPVQFKAQVAWCRGADNHHFAAGLRVYDDEPGSTQALARLTTRGSLEREDETQGLWARRIPKVVMS
jgi:hypothetical protein